MGEGITYPPNLPAHVERLLRIVDGISIWTGKLCACLIIPLLATLVYAVISRYFFSSPTLWAFDTTYMIYAAYFMLVATFALATHAHIRTDFLFRIAPVPCPAALDAALQSLFLLPAPATFTCVRYKTTGGTP